MSEADEIGMRDGSSMSALSPKCSLIAAVASSRKVDFTKSLVKNSKSRTRIKAARKLIIRLDSSLFWI
jgi:hypothetical protein